MQDAHPSSPATSRASTSPSPGNAPSLPLSIAPKALAEHLDNGWGDDDGGAEADPSAEAKPTGVVESTTRSAPTSVPPPVDEGDWDIPSAETDAAAGKSPAALQGTERVSTVPQISTRPVATASNRAATAGGPRQSTAPTVSGSTGIARMGAIAVRRSQPPAAGTWSKVADSKVADSKVADSKVADSKVADSKVATASDMSLAAPTATSDIADKSAEMAPPSARVDAPAIDITIEPTFPEVANDSARSGIVKSEGIAPMTAPSTGGDLLHRQKLLHPVTSMSPVSTPKSLRAGAQAVTSTSVKVWLLVAAGLAATGILWGVAGASRGGEASTRRGQTDPLVLGDSRKAEAPSVVAPAVTPPQAQPPPTGTVDNAAVAAEASPDDNANEKARVAKRKSTESASVATAPAKAAEPTNVTQPSAQPVAMGHSSPLINSPITPQTGIVDPRAFPSNDGATASKVRVEVDPPDTKVAVRGKLATAPYLFDVPKGSRVVLEVARTGYITRRIVLDGSRELVRIGMIPVPKSEEAPESPKAEPPKAAKVPAPKMDPGPSAAPDDL